MFKEIQLSSEAIRAVFNLQLELHQELEEIALEKAKKQQENYNKAWKEADELYDKRRREDEVKHDAYLKYRKELREYESKFFKFLYVKPAPVAAYIPNHFYGIWDYPSYWYVHHNPVADNIAECKDILSASYLADFVVMTEDQIENFKKYRDGSKFKDAKIWTEIPAEDFSAQFKRYL